MFHPKSPGVSLVLFSYMLSDMKSVEKPYSPKYGHGGPIFDHTIYTWYRKGGNPGRGGKMKFL